MRGMDPTTKAALIAASIGGAAGTIAGAQGSREGRSRRMMTGLAQGAILGRGIIRNGGFKNTMNHASILRNHIVGAGVGAVGALVTGGSMGSGALAGGLIGSGIGYGGQGVQHLRSRGLRGSKDDIMKWASTLQPRAKDAARAWNKRVEDFNPMGRFESAMKKVDTRFESWGKSSPGRERVFNAFSNRANQAMDWMEQLPPDKRTRYAELAGGGMVAMATGGILLGLGVSSGGLSRMREREQAGWSGTMGPVYNGLMNPVMYQR